MHRMHSKIRLFFLIFAFIITHHRDLNGMHYAYKISDLLAESSITNLSFKQAALVHGTISFVVKIIEGCTLYQLGQKRQRTLNEYISDAKGTIVCLNGLNNSKKQNRTQAVDPLREMLAPFLLPEELVGFTRTIEAHHNVPVVENVPYEPLPNIASRIKKELFETDRRKIRDIRLLAHQRIQTAGRVMMYVYLQGGSLRFFKWYMQQTSRPILYFEKIFPSFYLPVRIFLLLGIELRWSHPLLRDFLTFGSVVTRPIAPSISRRMAAAHNFLQQREGNDAGRQLIRFVLYPILFYVLLAPTNEKTTFHRFTLLFQLCSIFMSHQNSSYLFARLSYI